MAIGDIDVALADIDRALADIGIAAPIDVALADMGVAARIDVAVTDTGVAVPVGVAVADIDVALAEVGVAPPVGVAADIAPSDQIVIPVGTTPMTTSPSSPPVLLHELPGRVRVHIPQSMALAAPEALLRATAGVRAVSVNATTRNILIHFDPAVTTSAALLAALGAAPRATPADTLRAATAPLTMPSPAPLGQVLTAVAAQGGLDRAYTALKVVNLAVGLANASSPLGLALAALEAGQFLSGVLAA